MDELIDQIEVRLEQALKESNLDNILLQSNIILINSLTNLLAILLNNKNKPSVIKYKENQDDD
jgi:lipid A disaccharide synthetase